VLISVVAAARKAEKTAASALLLAVCGGLCVKHVCACYVCVCVCRVCGRRAGWYADGFLAGSWVVGFSRSESWISGCKEFVNVSGCGEWNLDLKRVEVCVYCVPHPVMAWERRRTK